MSDEISNISLNLENLERPVDAYAGLILGLHPADERRIYKVTPSLIGWVQT